MKKKLLAILLSVAVIIATLPLSAITVSAESYSGTCGDNLTWSLDTETGVLAIEGSGDMSDFGRFDYAPWFSNRSYIKSVTIGDNVTSIGNYAFRDCSSLTSVTIGDGVTSIGSSAFYSCSSLTSVTIGDGVTSIGSSAFSQCSSLTSVTIPDSVTSIGYDAFSDCSSLTSINITDIAK